MKVSSWAAALSLTVSPLFAFGEPAGRTAAASPASTDSIPVVTEAGAGPVIPGDGSGLPCVDIGGRTERIPTFDTIHRACLTDALAGPGEFDSAWAALMDRVRAGTGPLMPVWGGDIFNPDKNELQKAISRGTVDKESLDESRHWGDAVWLQMRPEKGVMRPTALFAVTYRTYKIPERDGFTLMATRVDFTADGSGRLNSVQFWSGIKLRGAPAMAWTQGPSRMISDSQSLEGLWGRRWRQLVRSWSY